MRKEQKKKKKKEEREEKNGRSLFSDHVTLQRLVSQLCREGVHFILQTFNCGIFFIEQLGKQNRKTKKERFKEGQEGKLGLSSFLLPPAMDQRCSLQPACWCCNQLEFSSTVQSVVSGFRSPGRVSAHPYKTRGRRIM